MGFYRDLRVGNFYNFSTKKIINDYERADNSVPIDWNPDTGYPKNLPPNYYPRAASGTGVSMGLSLILDSELEEYYCSTTNGPGFKVSVECKEVMV